MNTFFSITNLKFSFDQENTRPFFDGVHCSFARNVIHFIRGKNGAGKSTLFRILRGKTERGEYIEGTIRLGARTFNIAEPEQRAALSSCVRLSPQKFDEMLADQFTFPQNLQLASLPRFPGLTRFVETSYVPPLVDRFGIDYTVPVGMLSGGQRQILSILMALQRPTSILLLDEPTAALDDKNAGIVMAFLEELVTLNKELTVLIICHDKELVEQYAHTQYYQIEITTDNKRSLHTVPLPKNKD